MVADGEVNSSSLEVAEYVTESQPPPHLTLTPSQHHYDDDRLLSASTTTTNGPQAPVPDVLLSLAKDERYVSQVTSILSQIFVPFAGVFLLPRFNSSRFGVFGTPNDSDITEDDGLRLENVRPELNLFASIVVHISTFIYCKRFSNGKRSKQLNKKSWRSFGMESLNLAYHLTGNTPKNIKMNNKAYHYKSQANQEGENALIKENRFIFPSNAYRWCLLIFVQTAMPYLIQRLGRGGWSSDLSVISSAIRRLFRARQQIQLNQLPDEVRAEIRRSPSPTGENESTDSDEYLLRNDNRLRGVVRRRLFEEQRRRMMMSSEIIVESDENVDLTNSRDVSYANGSEIAEQLEEQESSPNILQHFNHQSTVRRLNANDVMRRCWEQLSALTMVIAKKVSNASSSMHHGAHSLPRQVRDVAMDNGVQSSAGPSDSFAKALKWLLRLHLALFYWNGIYPTIAHRVAGVSFQTSVVPFTNENSVGSSNGSIVANRPSYKPVAALILIQSLLSLAQLAANASIEVVHLAQVSFFRLRRLRQTRRQSENWRGFDSGSSCSSLQKGDSERDEYLSLIEEKVPGIVSSKGGEIKKGLKPLHKQAGSHSCGICLNERINPAAPSECGHVFCWNCILHWVSNVRSECPLCRLKTRPQDIVPLYNYS